MTNYKLTLLKLEYTYREFINIFPVNISERGILPKFSQSEFYAV